ncbi:hypothetical protein [Stenotrophomonas rhizophila]|uniref:hypothetical protein n=1 Tax=Stenotrophomonas rhizophila TaxID=216778 RepID=UPI001E419EA6|nr:hypothetical protein [Stenotrophomonas rhizophila]MCC7634070.1 hypothetical protein [Stenotrophomonas rhizophila]MCC7662766.1 hypothetical protein [Stenotrophomonas rhizophila]
MSNNDPGSPAMRWLSPLTLAMGVGMVALLARLLYIQYFGTPMPFWDQWDGEGASVIKPLVGGTLQFGHLLTPHNEHRIFPTRLVALATYLATGQWNNVYEARVGALVFCVIPALLVWHALRDAGAAAGRWLLVPVALLLSLLPFAWENFLVGFQSQFYFLILSSVVAVTLVARHHQSIIALTIAIALSVLASITMASGLLTAVAVGATCVMACLYLPGRRAPALCATVVLAVIAAVAYSRIPVIAGHGALRAQGPGELLLAATHTLAWPARDNGVFFIVWLPSIIMVLRMLVRRQATPTDLLMTGLCAWSALQGLAIAYGRGHDGMRVPPSRYTELFVPGLFANAWFAIQLWCVVPTPSRMRTAARTAAVAFALLLVGALLGQVSKDMGKIQKFSAACRLQQENVVRYLTSGDPEALKVGEFELPYPDAARLKAQLDDPAIRQALPVTLVAPSTPTTAEAPLGPR